ncbi:hypothetical protein MesoLjLb_53530 [Mesorhizobium sp. L-8-3]|nr:hypothetical protein MesoLjLb_53530 [Mesorhizobium sp. L-8-3]
MERETFGGFDMAGSALPGAERKREGPFARRDMRDQEGGPVSPAQPFHGIGVVELWFDDGNVGRPKRPECLRSAQAAIAFCRFSSILSRKPVVDSQGWSAPIRRARSLVM